MDKKPKYRGNQCFLCGAQCVPKTDAFGEPYMGCPRCRMSPDAQPEPSAVDQLRAAQAEVERLGNLVNSYRDAMLLHDGQSLRHYTERRAAEKAELARLTAENEALRKRLRWYRAAHLLVSNEFAFVGHRDGEDARLIYLDQNENYDPLLMVLCSDTFAWACADAERAEYYDAEKLLDIAQKDGWVGLMRWVQERRESLGDLMREPIPPVRKMFADHDALKAENEALRREVEDVRALDAAEESGEFLPWRIAYGRHSKCWYFGPNDYKRGADARRAAVEFLKKESWK